MYPDGDVEDATIVFKHAGWGSKEAQDLRYAAISSVYSKFVESFTAANRKRPRTIEVGCGFGIFFEKYAVKEGYVGVDINPQAIDYCQKRFPPEQFRIMDITSQEFEKFMDSFQADYIVASGVFDHDYIWRMIKNERLLHRILKKTRCAVVSTMLYDVTPVKFRNPLHAEQTVYTSPADILSLFTREISRQEVFYQIKYDYMDNDYTFALINPYQLTLDETYRRWKNL